MTGELAAASAMQVELSYDMRVSGIACAFHGWAGCMHKEQKCLKAYVCLPNVHLGIREPGFCMH